LDSVSKELLLFVNLNEFASHKFAREEVVSFSQHFDLDFYLAKIRDQMRSRTKEAFYAFERGS